MKGTDVSFIVSYENVDTAIKADHEVMPSTTF
jgi:hypothetical protein